MFENGLDPDTRRRSKALQHRIAEEINASGGWISFARFMERALYTPGLGYYSSGAAIFGKVGDFVTAPEISPLFGQALAVQARQVMASSAPCILEVGAGSGCLARDLLSELERLGHLPECYAILEISGALRARQRKTLGEGFPRGRDCVRWIDALPERFDGLVLANEVLDAMPVHRVRWPKEKRFPISECGVGWENGRFAWKERPAEGLLRERAEALASELSLSEGQVGEIGLAAESWVSAWGQRLGRGAVILMDYGFPRRERFHPARHAGTLMCHYRHSAHGDPFFLPGVQDITAHIDFTAIAEAGFDAGLDVLGYAPQTAFLLNCGITQRLSFIGSDIASHAVAARSVDRLLSPSGMGELFKVIALGKGIDETLLGFSNGDRRAAL